MSARVSLFAVLFVAMMASSAFGRKWTDASGKFSTEADFVEIREGKVILKKNNGALISVPLQKLSAIDRQFIKSSARASDAPETMPGGLTIRRDEGVAISVDAGSETLPPFVAFAFFSKPPTRDQLQAARKYMSDRFKVLSTTKVAVGNDKSKKMTGLQIMQFVGGFAAGNDNSSLTLSPFHGAGNKSGHFGLMGDSFDVGPEKVVILVVYCVEIGGDKPKKYEFDFDGLGLEEEVVGTIRASKGTLVLSCNANGQLGPSGEQVEE